MRSCMTEIGNIQLLSLCPSGVNPTSMGYSSLSVHCNGYSSLSGTSDIA